MSTAGCRAAVLDAFVRLEGREGRIAFLTGDVVEEVQRATQAFKASTVQTYVSAVMCADAPKNHANHTDDLRRVGRGRYRRAIDWQGSPAPEAVMSDALPVPVERVLSAPQASLPPAELLSPPPATSDRHAHWAWEGNVQAVVAAALAASAWQLRSVADTASRAQGVDIIADRAGRRLLVEVKGYPAGSSSANTQARHHFGDALLAGVLMAERDADATCVLAFPAFTTYTNLVPRSRSSLERLGFGVLLVSEKGVVTEPVVPASGTVLTDGP